VVAAVDTAHAEFGGTYRELGAAAGTPVRSLLRWCGRQRRGAPLLSVPGPGKFAPLEIGTLVADLLALAHGRKRTAGTGDLWRKFQEQMSRRALQEVVEMLRLEHWRRVKAEQRRITWLTPGLVWSMDDMEMLTRELGLTVPDAVKFFWNQVRDLASRYQFAPLVTPALATGEVVAAHLRRLFDEFAAPLFFKRDNGGNLNEPAVEKLFGEYMVIPLNSPPHYPPYNGGMEKGQDEFQGVLRTKMLGRKWPEMWADEMVSVLQMASEAAAHELDQRKRPCLKNVSARYCFEVGKQDRRSYYNRQQRREVFDEVRAMAAFAMAETGLTGWTWANMAWRLAVETWLRREGHIAVSVGKKVLPYFHDFSMP
jgi:hypothetical protein